MVKQRGFTLIEILVVLALSYIGLAGMLSLQVVATHSNARSRGLTEATGLAQDKLEELRRLPLARLATHVEQGVDALGNVNAGGGYTRRVTVTPTASGFLVNVAVAFNDVRGRPHQVQVSTVRAP